MKLKQIAVCSVFGAALFAGGVAVGQDVNGTKHPHLAQAQRMIGDAMKELDESQSMWGDKLGGHANKAKELLRQADGEIKQAAEYANVHK